MARIRTIKPEFWSDEKVVECSVNARLLFIGLWNFSDDTGRQDDAPKQIKMKIFPGDDTTASEIDGMLRELSVNGLVTRYVVDGKRFIQINGWRHQVINKPQKSKIPPCPNFSAEHSGNDTGELPVGMEWNGRERKGMESSPKPPSAVPVAATKIDDEDRSKADSEWDGIEDEIWSMAGLRSDGHRVAGKVDDYRLVKSWRNSGATPDQIRQACKAVIERAGEIRSLWKLLAAAVPEELQKLRTEYKPPADGIDPRWPLRVKAWLKSPGSWCENLWGHPPDHPKTEVPGKILAEFKITVKKGTEPCLSTPFPVARPDVLTNVDRGPA